MRHLETEAWRKAGSARFQLRNKTQIIICVLSYAYYLNQRFQPMASEPHAIHLASSRGPVNVPIAALHCGLVYRVAIERRPFPNGEYNNLKTLHLRNVNLI